MILKGEKIQNKKIANYLHVVNITKMYLGREPRIEFDLKVNLPLSLEEGRQNLGKHQDIKRR